MKLEFITALLKHLFNYDFSLSLIRDLNKSFIPKLFLQFLRHKPSDYEKEIEEGHLCTINFAIGKRKI